MVVPDELLVDLVHRSFHRMFEGDGEHPPAAPSVRVVNLSIGDPAREFIRRLSPLAKLLDWLAHRYNVIIVVSTGNHDIHPTVPAATIGAPEQLREATRASTPRRAAQPSLALSCGGRERRHCRCSTR